MQGSVRVADEVWIALASFTAVIPIVRISQSARSCRKPNPKT